MSGLDLPTVRLCDRPACGAGWMNPCAGSRPGSPFGLALWIRASVSQEDIRRVFAQELAIGGASDSNGTMHVTPAGDFTVHRAPHQPQSHRPPEEPADAVLWTCIYDGPGMDRDEALADAPEWTHDLMLERYHAFQQVGLAP